MKTTESKLLARYKKALAQSRENYAAVVEDNRRLQARNDQQAGTIYRLRETARKMAACEI